MLLLLTRLVSADTVGLLYVLLLNQILITNIFLYIQVVTVVMEIKNFSYFHYLCFPCQVLLKVKYVSLNKLQKLNLSQTLKNTI